ncbi:MAG: helix-turn-helix transcriptional regulator [Eubacterium sp.]|nr:helix-turn-helix transcriptional regulator [Eubacterium sp.]
MNYIENELVGKRLEKVRTSRGKGCYEMAEALGISEGHYRKIERGMYGLDVRKMLLLQRKMGIDPLYLLTGKITRENSYQIPGGSANRNAYVCELLEYCKEQLEEMAEDEK